ncbi:MAG: nitroreductase [Fusobacteriaceae bacterium]|nr:nitroreductase [Fusobacteriaceae bacterium]MBN2839263.1 nitroreductase [Fusobacteriaceae bacterium]
MKFPIEETIIKRSSIRSYESKKLSTSDKEKLMDYINNLSNPFNEKVNFHFIEKGLEPKVEKLGTYGIIKGATSFIGVSVPDSEFGLEAAGYEFEQLILYATHLGLGTVWLAMTFSRNEFMSAMDIKKDNLFPAISPIGYSSEKKTIKERLMRKMMKSNQRKSWENIFFKNNFSSPLAKEEAGDYKIPLEMLRLAPSATNAQPWRVIKEKNMYHFYESHKSGASKEDKSIKRVDLGIAINHFHLTTLEYNLSGRFEKIESKKSENNEELNYIISWISE